METIKSLDGTLIGFERAGHGPALILLHGTGSNHTRWLPLFPELTKRFTAIAVDRRGRGGSGDADAYSILREFEDVAAVVDSLGEPVYLLGHSFGGLCALEGALLTANVRRLVLYEPVVIPDMSAENVAVVGRLRSLLERGDREGLIETFYREMVGMSPEQITDLKAQPDWPARVAAAHTIVREDESEGAYSFDADRLRKLSTETLLLEGRESSESFRTSTRAVHEALPNSRVVTLEGQGHIAMITAPDLFLREVLAFFSD